ncbi:MAG: EAL domain-containing protein [Clostridia bacterium]|nr:EAL domain-containing protein [Clostridia bacterium]
MLNGKRVIAVCTTKLHTPLHTEFVCGMHRLAQQNNCKLMVFNTFVDFFNNDAQDEGAASVFRMMNFRVIDAVVIFADSFYSAAVVEDIISRAQQEKLPVVMVKGQAEGCWNIRPDYRDTYCALLEHVIRDHGIRDVLYLTGKQGNPEAELRADCFRTVLERNGISFTDDMLIYADLWNEPAAEAVRGLAQSRGKLPGAIFCANDSMALGVCSELAQMGCRVPEDVVVTGFDGIPAADSFPPRITTCREDVDALAKAALDAALAGLAGEQPRDITYSHILHLTESCGCPAPVAGDGRPAFRLYDALDTMQRHEDYIYDCIDHMQNISGMNSLTEALSYCIIANSHVCLNSSFVADALGATQESEHPFSDELVVVSSHYTPSASRLPGRMLLSDMLPQPEAWAEDDTACVITPVHVGRLVCGYYVLNTGDLSEHADKIKRVARAVNIALSSAVSRFRQSHMNLRLRRASITDPVTGLPNLKGAVQWFESFAANNANHYKTLSVTVYSLPKYAYILENHGMDAVEETLRITAEALKMANPAHCFIAHTAQDTFTVIHYYIDGNDVGDTINDTGALFFSQIEGYNSRSSREYFVEVNSGCTVVPGGWTGTLEGYLREANAQLYKNRLKQGMGVAGKDVSDPHTYYAAFHLLLKNNLFHYHFQPIVSAETGDVYAYEALMRTDKQIGMSPTQVLEAARQYNRLYDVEKYSLFNILERYVRDRDRFGERPVFINTIPGYFLRQEDIDRLSDQYGEYLSRVVLELTEENTLTDEELETIRHLWRHGCGSIIALDDYGMGHSNIVNLLRYAPQIVKIDHYLIHDIHNSPNKQMVVRSTIEFARHNSIRVLAEGVETYEELRMLIEMGVDLIQGFYTGRPVHDPIDEIDPEVKQQILAVNEEMHREE